MRKTTYFIPALFMLAIISAGFGQSQKFTPVAGPGLKSRLDSAMKLARARSPQARTWIAYAFDIRPGIALDPGRSGADGSALSIQGVRVSLSPGAQTKSAGIFLSYEPGTGAITQLEVHDLDQAQENLGSPVLWIDRATRQESLEFLKGLAESNQAGALAGQCASVIALHDDPQAADLLQQIVRRSPNEEARAAAIFWLGQFPGNESLLIDIARSERENLDVRKMAVSAIAAGKDRSAVSALQGLFDSVSNPEVKRQVLLATALSDDKEAAIHFLQRVAASDPDENARKQSIFKLAEMNNRQSLVALNDLATQVNNDAEAQKQAVFALGRRSEDEAALMLVRIAKTHPNAELRNQAIAQLGGLGSANALAALEALANGEDVDTEMQRQAVFAISRKPKDEAVPALIKIAGSHKKAEVRKQAALRLTQIDDPRAKEFLKAMLSR